MMHHPLPDIETSRKLALQLFAGPPATPTAATQSPLILYGAGNLGNMALRLLQQLAIEVPYVVDRHPPASGQLQGIPVIVPEAVPAADRQNLRIGICVVTAPYEPIRTFLNAAGWRNVHPVYDLLQPHAATTLMENGWFLPKPDSLALSQILNLLDAWHDDRSRAAHLQFLAWRYARQEWMFDGAPVTVDDRYFISEVVAALGDKEYFIDAGAYDGSVTERFLRVMAGREVEATLIEPDPVNRARLARRFSSNSEAAAIHLLDCVLDEQAGQTRFANNLDLGSRIHPHGIQGTPAQALDDLDLRTSFAKFHLEGHELPALRGSLATLRRERPILAVTVYHNADGAWPTGCFLAENLARYRLIMRLHGWCGTAAVLYAIPEERLERRKA